MRRGGLYAFAAVLLLTGPLPAATVSLDLPDDAEQTADLVQARDEYLLPIGPYADGQVPTQPVYGRVERRAWKIVGTTLTTLQLMDPIRSALEEAGFDIRLSCDARSCGEFDFRFAIEVLPAPAMFVDIFNYRMLTAINADGRAVSVLVTRVTTDAFMQITQISPETTSPIPIETTRPTAPVATAAAPQLPVGEQQEIGAALMTKGHAVLEDLTFASGSDRLVDDSYASLKSLAGFLQQDPGLRVMLVGHTDAVGELAGNIELSRRRAAAVVDRLKTRFGIAQAQLGAGGMGYLAPRASNLTPEGRSLNRRVEAVLLNTKLP